MASTSTNINLTVVQLDLVNSSKSFQAIHTKYDFGNAGLREFIKQIEEIISKAFQKSVKNRDIKHHLTKIETPMADGCRLTFESVENAYDFVKIFSQSIDERNQKTGIDQWSFRIGAATDNVNYDPSRINQMVGNILMVVKELETGAFPGWLFIDETTYNGLSQDIQNKFSQQNFTNKHQQQKNAWGCPIFVNSNVESQPQPILWNDVNRQQLISILDDVFTEEELQTICINNQKKLKGNPYSKIQGNTPSARASYLVDYLIRKRLIDDFLDILCQKEEYFADLVKPLLK